MAFYTNKIQNYTFFILLFKYFSVKKSVHSQKLHKMYNSYCYFIWKIIYLSILNLINMGIFKHKPV